jgi:hypothetical protein
MGSITEDIVTDVIALLGSPFTTANVLVGERERESNNLYPRVVFVPVGGPIVDPDRVGHGKVTTTDRQRIIALRQLSVMVECHASTNENAEILLHNCVAAIRKTIHNSGPFPMSESYPDQDDGEDSFDKAGSLAVFTFTVHVPIYDVIRPLKVPITFVEASETFDGESVPCNV